MGGRGGGGEARRLLVSSAAGTKAGRQEKRADRCKLRRTPEGLLLRVRSKVGFEANFRHPFFLPSGLSSCEPRKRNPALFPASPSPSHKYLGCVLAPLVKKQKPYNNNNNNNNNSNNKNNICCIIAFPSSRGTQPRVIASGPGCGWRGAGAIWLFRVRLASYSP